VPLRRRTSSTTQAACSAYGGRFASSPTSST
jgi:hypothetical protein